MATLAIGDVHGQLSQLRQLVATAKGNQLILLGDLVGRGKDSLAVLREVAKLEAQVILGNHDLHLLWAYYGRHELDASYNQILEASDCEQLCTWLRQQKLAVAVPGANAICLHAAVWHSWDNATLLNEARAVEAQLQSEDFRENIVGLYGNDYLGWDTTLTGHARTQASVNILTRMRVCDREGKMIAKYIGKPGETIPENCYPWFDYPQRKLINKLLVCGHWSSHGLLVRKDLAMLDTGCCFGGPLTGMWLEDRRLVFAN